MDYINHPQILYNHRNNLIYYLYYSQYNLNHHIEIHQKINSIDSQETFEAVRLELEDRFGKLDENLIIYMYEEWFEKLAKAYEIEKVNNTKNSIELVFSEEITKKIDGEKLFEDSFKITPMFRFKMLHERLIVVLDIIKLEKHYIYYLVELLDKIKFKNDWVCIFCGNFNYSFRTVCNRCQQDKMYSEYIS